MGVPKGKEKKNSRKAIFEETVPRDYTKLTTYIMTQSHQNKYKDSLTSHIIRELLETGDKRSTFKLADTIRKGPQWSRQTFLLRNNRTQKTMESNTFNLL